jgi:hypothetical protein
MKSQQELYTRFTLATVATVLAMLTLVLWGPAARAEALAEYRPQVLMQAELAIEEGNPGRALALLRQQRAILGHEKYYAEGQALACQAYFAKGQSSNAERACGNAAAWHARHEPKEEPTQVAQTGSE